MFNVKQLQVLSFQFTVNKIDVEKASLGVLESHFRAKTGGIYKNLLRYKERDLYFEFF